MEYYTGIEEPWKRFGVDQITWENPAWQRQNAIENPSDLAKVVRLTPRQVELIDSALGRGKKMRVLPYSVALMGDNPTGVDTEGISIDDKVNAIFTQGVPTPAHYLFNVGSEDPMAEGSRSIGAAYQRYVGTVAMMTSLSAICHFFCTHCQRKKDMSDSIISQEDREIGIEYVQKNGNVWEVLLTGGDPLALPSDQLDYLLKSLSPHVESIRIATRLPVTNPFAVTQEKLDIIAKYSKHKTGDYTNSPNIYFVTHANAPEELTLDMQKAVSRIKNSGFDIRNQTVLLKGVNDDFGRLSRLFRGLHQMGVIPYYMFQCHKVDGLASEIVPINIGQYLIAELRGQPGTSIPKYSVNMIGGGGKVELNPQGDLGIPNVEYQLKRKFMRTWDNQIREYEALLRVNESDYEAGMQAMKEFYGDEDILRYEESEIAGGLCVRKTKSRKFRPSMIVVSDDDPNRVLYVTNVKAPSFKSLDDKCTEMGYKPNAEYFGLSGNFITNPSGAKLPSS